jgi:DNA mismatch repair protein MutL
VRVLPAEVASQIAAGEVVERPASVVKELLENALDAGAHRITVELEGAGSALIAVVDDGEGMGPDDAVCAFSRHATSKIATAADLERIATLGFRGEALASIAAVSETTLTTRCPGDLEGTCVELRHGTVVDVRAAGAPPGTRVEVRELFGNTPARRKFLKAPATEVGHVSELVTRTALAFPQVGFVLRHGGRTLIEFAGVEDHAERVRQVFGNERASAMFTFLGRGVAGAAYGWLADPRLTLPSPRHIYTYVNRRYVRDKLVSHALVAGYSTLLMHGRYPAAVVFVEVAADEVDVNVHPAKSEVRFRRSGAVHELLAHAVQDRLRERGAGMPSAAPPAPFAAGPLLPETPLPFGPGAPGAWLRPLRLVDVPEGAAPGGGQDFRDLMFLSRPASGEQRAASGEQRGTRHEGRGASDERPAASDGFFSSLRVLGQVFDGYVVCESADSLVLIDQHAAHERVTFERLRAAYDSGAVPGQRLLVPAVVELGAREAALLTERAAELAALGFDVEPFGGTSFSVRAVPALLGDTDPAALLRDVAEELAELGRSQRIGVAVEAVLARLACHSAVRVGHSLGLPQIRALLAAMDRIDFAGHCPHGRPAWVRFVRSDLERWFKRT